MEDRDYKFAPLISKDVASALAKSLDRQFDRGASRDDVYDGIMRFIERNNPEIIGFVKDRCAEFGQNNPELDADYIDGYFQGAREAMLNVIYLIYTQMEQNKLRESFEDIESWGL